MVVVGQVDGLFRAKEGSSGLPRPKADMLSLLTGHGIEGDKFAGKDPDRAVMIVGQKAYAIARENGIELEPGSLGENILLDFDPHNFPSGTIFAIGDTRIQITEGCIICHHLSRFDPRLPELVLNHSGLYCKILKDGEITKGLTVILGGKE